MIDQKYRVRVNREPLISGDKRTMRKKRWIVWGAIAGVVLLVVILGLILLGGRDAEPEQTTTGAAELTLQIERGEVQVKGADDEDFVDATDGMDIEIGTTVRTGSDGLAALELVIPESSGVASGTATRLNQDTRAVVVGSSADMFTVELTSGQVWTTVDGLDPAASQIVTDIVRIEAQSTSFDTAVEVDSVTVRAIADTSVVTAIDEQDDSTSDKGKLFLQEDEQTTVEADDLPETEDDFDTGDIDEEFLDSFWYRWNTEQDAEFTARLAGDEDTDGPTLTISSPKDGDETEDEQIEVKGSTDVSATVTINGDEVETEDGEFTFSVDLDEGKNEIEIIATDPSGNETEKTLTITRTEEELDAVSVTLDTSSAGSILVSWEVSEEEEFGGYVVKRNDATLTEISDRETTEYRDEDVEDGSEYSYSVCVQDRDGKEACSGTKSATAEGEANEAPAVSLTSPADEASVAGGSAVNFTATGSDPEGAALTYSWDFGDGATATGQSVSHTYATTTTAKTLTVTVTVSDPEGKTDEASITITVTP